VTKSPRRGFREKNHCFCELALAAVRALALRVAADCIEHGGIPEPFTKVFRWHEPLEIGQGHAHYRLNLRLIARRSMALWPVSRTEATASTARAIVLAGWYGLSR